MSENDPPACPDCQAPWSSQRLTVDLPIQFMWERDGKIFLRVPYAPSSLYCTACGKHRPKPENVKVGD